MNNAKVIITNREKAFKNIKTMDISILPPPIMLIMIKYLLSVLIFCLFTFHATTICLPLQK